MNIKIVETRLHTKAKDLKLHKQRITAQIKRYEIKRDKLNLKIECVLINPEQSSFLLKGLAREKESYDKHIKSLDKVLHQIKLDQRAYGKCIQNLISLKPYRDFNWLDVEMVKMKLLEDLFNLLTRDPNYDSRFYEWGSSW